MAQDWIKMRTWLAKDPKVIAMANELAFDKRFMEWTGRECEKNAYEHVDQKIIISIVVAGLLQVWGTIRLEGKRPSQLSLGQSRDMSLGHTWDSPLVVPGGVWDMSDDDLVLTGATTITLDDICSVDGFGEAMKQAGWVIEVKGSRFALVFPKFFEQNHDTEELKREKERERKQRQRAKNASMSLGQSRDMSQKCPTRGEESREEKSKKEEEVTTSPMSADPDASTYDDRLGPTRGELQDAWNHVVTKGVRCQSMNGKRGVHLKNRNRDPHFRENWLAAMHKIAESPFCCGDNQRGWVATIDWFLRPDTVLKLIEGFYDGREPAAKGGFLAELYGGKA